MSKLDVDKHIDVEVTLDELDLTSAESKATYAQIKEYILEKCSCDKTFLRYVKNNYGNMAGASQKAMAKVIQAWLTIKTSNVTITGGNLSCRK